MTRARHKNKKPETKNKNRACNYFLGSFGSPCGFWRLANAARTERCLAWLDSCYRDLAQLPTPSPD